MTYIYLKVVPRVESTVKKVDISLFLLRFLNILVVFI